MSGAITAQEAVEARNRIEGALAARINHSLICFGDIPQEIIDALFEEFGITSDDVADNCWWAFGRYLPEGLEETAPNFRLMDDLSIALIDDAAFDEYIEKSKALLDELLALVVVDCVH